MRPADSRVRVRVAFVLPFDNLHSLSGGTEGFFCVPSTWSSTAQIHSVQESLERPVSMKHHHIPINSKSLILLLFTLGSLSSFTRSNASSYATEVIAYTPGTGFAVEFGSGLGYTNTLAVLGEPSRITPGPFGGPVDPFSPPYLSEQLLSVGEGGSVILSFDTPIFNHPDNPYGLDFILFGHTGFNIINGDYSGGGITDGSLFGTDTAEVSISVSEDNVVFYSLNSVKTPKLDAYFPTDGSGHFHIPVNPMLGRADFDQAGLNAIRDLYQGSGGGTGFDLDWAMGSPEDFAARYVKIEVTSGKIELDAASIVGPAATSYSNDHEEDFSTNPTEPSGWRAFGDSSLFAWDSEHERLSVTWDSRKPNSYFYLPFGSRITRHEDFSVSFTLQLDHIELGIDPEKSFTFPLAIGLIQTREAFRDNFYRGSGIHADYGPRGLVEWSYHPDSGFGATISSGLISQDNQWSVENTFPLELQTGSVYEVELNYTAADQTLRTTMTEDGSPFGPIKDANLGTVFGGPAGGFTEINVDAFALINYSDAQQPSPEWDGSILANGWVDNVSIQRHTALHIEGIERDESSIRIKTQARAGWEYWLESTDNFTDWETRGYASPDANGALSIKDLGPEQTAGFYRVRSHPKP